MEITAVVADHTGAELAVETLELANPARARCSSASSPPASATPMTALTERLHFCSSNFPTLGRSAA